MIKVYPEQYGAKADGKYPSRWAIQICLNDLGANGGGELDLSRGRYAITDSGLIIPGNVSIVIRGNGPQTGLVPSSGLPQSTNVLFSQGGQIVFPSYASADARAGDLGVRTQDAYLFSKGDTVRIAAAMTSGVGTVIWGTQHNQVVDISGDMLILAIPLAFPLQAEAWVQRTLFSRSLFLSDFSVISENTGVDHNGIVLTWERNAFVENVLCEGQGDTTVTHGGGAGLILSDGYQNTVRNVRVMRGGSNGEDAIAFRLQSALAVDSVHSVAGVFGIGVTATDSQFSNLSSMRDYGRGIKLNGTYSCRFSNLLIGGSRHVGLGLTSGSSFNAFNGVTVRGVNTPGGQNIGVWFNGESNNYNSVTDLITQNVPSPVAQTPTDVGNKIQHAIQL